MKKMINAVTAVVLSAVLFMGCATTGPSNPVTQQLVTVAAQLGTVTYLTSHPADKPYFVATEIILQEVAGETNQVNVATIQQALAAAGQTNAIVTLAVVDALSLANSYIQSSGTTNNYAFQEAAGWVATGIAQGLQVSLTKQQTILKHKH